MTRYFEKFAKKEAGKKLTISSFKKIIRLQILRLSKIWSRIFLFGRLQEIS